MSQRRGDGGPHATATDPAGGPGCSRAFWFFAEDRDADWPAAEFDATVEGVDGGRRVRVTARTILRTVN
ncbi:hypothetical protein [Micromonospora sp. MW-13]|uniref:hypothetical protein n=1 Tax=Micromonospora sp. MW-13 TaxID=2094022 RepID=UPI000E438AE4|nr:hypothetical protein [Micromonospora sp. MW-13]